MRTWRSPCAPKTRTMREGDWVDDVEASIPVAPSSLKVFRVLHLFSGFRRKGDLEWWIRLLAQSCDFIVEVYSIDLAVDPAMDLTKEEVVADLRAACSRGWFHALMGGPPCNTWARARFNQKNPSPRPLRTRSEPWGRTDITMTASEQKKIFLGTRLLLAALELIEALCGSGGLALLEHPRDPGGPPFPSIWNLPEMKRLLDLTGGKMMFIEQCMYGLAAKKETTIGIFGGAANEEDVQRHLRRRCTHSSHALRLEGFNKDGSFKTSLAQVYPSGLCRALAKAILAGVVHMAGAGLGATEVARPEALAFAAPAPGRTRDERRRGDRVPAPPLATAWSRVGRWKLVYAGRWREPEHINVQELRTVCGLLRHLSRSTSAYGSRVLVLLDSMVALGAGSKGRSSARPLLRLCRQMAPAQVILGIRLLLRYIPSELNPADGPSRGTSVGAAPETKVHHADRLKESLPTLSASSALRLLRLGRGEAGFAGG